jgi:hypothetical protein
MKAAVNFSLAAYISDDVRRRAGDDTIDLIIERSKSWVFNFNSAPSALQAGKTRAIYTNERSSGF